MDSSGDDKGSQSSCKLTPLISLEKKESPVNPYNRVDSAKANANWPVPDTDDNEISAVNSLPRLDCGAFSKSYMDTCPCCPRETADSSRQRDASGILAVAGDDGCCRAHWERKDRYEPIKARVNRAVKVRAIGGSSLTEPIETRRSNRAR